MRGSCLVDVAPFGSLGEIAGRLVYDVNYRQELGIVEDGKAFTFRVIDRRGM